MAMRRRNVFYWVLIAVLIVIPLVNAFVRETMAVSQCTGLGGTFDYAVGGCDPAGGPHPHLPFGARHQGLMALTVMLLFFIAVAKWVTWNRKMNV